MDSDTSLSAPDLEALVESARELSSQIDLPELLARILVKAGELTDSTAGSVLLYDRCRHGLYFAAATGDASATVLARFGEGGSEVVPLEGSKAGAVYRSGESLIVQSTRADPNHFKGVDRRTHKATDSMICVPLGGAGRILDGTEETPRDHDEKYADDGEKLTLGDQKLGVVQIINKRSGEYTIRDKVLLENFAAHAAVAIRNAQSIQMLLAHMGLYGSSAEKHKAQEMIAELDKPARRERMTLLFADMRGFTRLTKTIDDPKDLQALLNEFLTALSNEIIRFGGVVNKFLGDGLLALFRHDDYERRAVQSAFAILDRTDALRASWEEEEDEDLSFVDVGIGIVTNRIMIGSIGSPKVRDFTVIGSHVNLAAAFEAEARGGKRVLVDQTTFVAARDLITDFEGPRAYILQKPDQPIGFKYKQYHIKAISRVDQDRSTTLVDNDDTRNPKESLRLLENLSKFYNNSWAIVVGIDSYEDAAIPKLSYAVRDAEAVASELPNLGFSKKRIEVLLNQEATKESLSNALYGKVGQLNEDDRLFVFLALHGEKFTQGEYVGGYLLPYDADPTNLPKTALRMADLAKCGQELAAKHILFTLDTCFSGYAARRGGSPPADERSLRALTDKRVVQILTAGASEESAMEDGGHGIFTRFLLQGLRGDADPEGTGLTAIQLASFVSTRVRQASDGRQTPQISKLDGEGEFLFLPPMRS